MVLTAYTCMVVVQKAIEAKGCAWLRQHSATTAIALVNGHSVIHLDFHLWHLDHCCGGVLWDFYLSVYAHLLER